MADRTWSGRVVCRRHCIPPVSSHGGISGVNPADKTPERFYRAWPKKADVWNFFPRPLSFCGFFVSCRVALFIDVLPDKEAAGRDLGVANVASNIGQMLAPVAAGQVVALTAGYSSLFIMSIIAVAISAVAIIPVKKVR